MRTLLAIAAGGAFGSAARYGVTQWLVQATGSSVWGTFAVNVTGSFILGSIVGLTEQRVALDPVLRAGLTVGVLGGYTTFSTLMYESAHQFETRIPLQAGLNLAGSILIGLTAVGLGLAAGRSAGA